MAKGGGYGWGAILRIMQESQKGRSLKKLPKEVGHSNVRQGGGGGSRAGVPTYAPGHDSGAEVHEQGRGTVQAIKHQAVAKGGDGEGDGAGT